MVFNQRTLSAALTVLLLMVSLAGCGDVGETPNPKKTPQINQLTIKDSTKDRLSQIPQTLEPILEGRNFLNREKLAKEIKEDRDSKVPPRRRHRRGF
ncbi:MAG: hypothetical protein PHU44_19260 [Syntrophales bacterium]|nr:hypothetical protein [Syntrophales bacterium]MDD5641200.1 hypothetical protein [Syntrophales bacterium]